MKRKRENKRILQDNNKKQYFKDNYKIVDQNKIS